MTTLASFDGTDGSNPTGGLVMDGQGNLYGTTYQRGADDDGTVFEIAQGSNTITTLASFDGADGAEPTGGLVTDGQGNMYGTAEEGGADDDGTVFEIAKGSNTITTLASFDGTNGVFPRGNLTLDGQGNLYGTTFYGGADVYGSVFEIVKGSNAITTLASFNGTSGVSPTGSLVLDGQGNLYGTTYQGGAADDGTVFEIAKGSNTITTLASFNGANGTNPSGGLVLDGQGNLYGTTFFGGAAGSGTAFEVAKGSGTITAVASFNGADGATPSGGLVLDGQGNLYGTTYQGGPNSDGTVFEIAKGSNTVTTLSTFDVTNGSNPLGGLVLDSQGNLYGTSYAGGASGYGTVFELGTGAAIDATAPIFSADGGIDYGYQIDGTLPQPTTVDLDWASGTTAATVIGSPIVSTATSTAPGTYNLNATPAQLGTPPAGATDLLVIADPSNLISPADASKVSDLALVTNYAVWLTTLASFNGADRPQPYTGNGLVLDSQGNLYGTAETGGADNYGTVFEIAKGSNTVTILASFNGTNGEYPRGNLVLDSQGNLYGTTSGNETSVYGTVFEIAKGSSTLTTLASFDGTDGDEPTGNLVLDAQGNLYGTTFYGGADNAGEVFELAQGSNTITTLASFYGYNGAYPYSGLVMDGQGNLYGTTLLDNGAVFEIAKGSNTIRDLAFFGGADGSQAYGTLVVDGLGNLYGTTADDGPAGDGEVFEVASGMSTITILASFNGANGSDPFGGLIMDGLGNLYGTTTQGGADNDGTVFEIPQGSNTITTLASFNGTNGSGPMNSLILDAEGHMYGTQSVGVFELGVGGTIHATAPTFSSDGGIDYGYQVDGTLPEATNVDLDWASGTTAGTVIGDPVVSTTTTTALGTYELYATPAQLGAPPAGATDLLVVVDPDRLISPADPSKVMALALPASATPTTITGVSGGGTYDGTSTLTATLSAGGLPVVGETIAFTVDEAGEVTPVGTATTNASGIATLPDVSLDGLSAGSYSGAVGANFAGDSILDSSTAGGNLTVNPAQATLTLSGLSFTYAGTPYTATVSTDPEGLAGVTVTYLQNGVVVAAPIQPGSYSVTATLNNPNYTATSVTGTLVINLAAPSIVGEQPIFQRKTNKHGKPVGRPVLTGFLFDFSAPLNPSSATNSANYRVDSITTKRVKGRIQLKLHPITRFSVAYSAASDVITLMFAGKQTFPSGGQIEVLSGPSFGVTGTSGTPLAGNNVFTISSGGKEISPG